MNREPFFSPGLAFGAIALALALVVAGASTSIAAANDVTDQAEETLEVAKSFLEAAGAGDVERLSGLMSEDFVWHNEGDERVPWIGTWEGQEAVLQEFLPRFADGLETTSWTTEYSFASGDQAVFIGTMTANATNSGESTGPMSWAVRVHVDGDKVKSWNWFEDSYAVSRAYHGKTP